MSEQSPFGTLSTLRTSEGILYFYSLDKLASELGIDIRRLPFTVKVLLECALRNVDGRLVTEDDVVNIANWKPDLKQNIEIPFKPARVILQDFTGVPCVADLAAMRGVVYRKGGNPEKINPIVPVDLVIDHSVQVDFFGTSDAFRKNVEKEFERNRERYVFLRWAQKAFNQFRVVPPGTGIVHQVNLEYLANVVQRRNLDGRMVAFPDTLVGTDSHTTMINGLGVLGWGVGGIEAEACMLGQPLYMLMPEVVGFKLTGRLIEGATATDLVLTVTEMLRKKGVVGKFVEFYGDGLSHLSLADRATVSNMAPEYGATVGFFPIDDETLRYLRGTGRDRKLVETVEFYSRAQNLFRYDGMEDPLYSDTLELDLRMVEPSLAGPKRPQDRVPLRSLKKSVESLLLQGESIAADKDENANSQKKAEIIIDGKPHYLMDGSVVIAAITSCTNTSNPSVMIGAGLLAKKAVEAGLCVSPLVKTSLAPGSRVVTEYLEASGLMPYLEKLGFALVGYGCTTCIGNSGPLPEPIEKAIREKSLNVAAVLSGNRNFEGRIHPLVKLAYLASPPLVVAFGIAGTVDFDPYGEPLGVDGNGNEVFLKDIWPTQDEIRAVMEKTLNPEIFMGKYAEVFEGDDMWKSLDVPEGSLYRWDPTSTYIQEPPFFDDFELEPPAIGDIRGARILVLLGDSVTTDHISPAGSIPKDSPAGQFLISMGVKPSDFNSYGSRRGNHLVMIRGTFANIRLRNLAVPGKEGGFAKYVPTGEITTIYDAAERYRKEGIPLVVVGGKEYGSGSSRDWAAKGTMLLGVKAVIAESYERIHRSNLVGMGVLPLEFMEGESAEKWGLTGDEELSIEGISSGLEPRKTLTVRVKRSNGEIEERRVLSRLDTPVEVEYYKNGGILQTVLRDMLRAK
jgi:aconitate hydratase